MRKKIPTPEDNLAPKEDDEARLLLAAIVESSDDAIISKTLDGVVTSWNRAAERLFGYRAEEMLDHSIRRIIPDERQHEEDDMLARIRQGERVDHFETVRRTKDGHLVNVSVSISPLRNAQGVIIGASKIARDITERRRAEEWLERLIETTQDAVLSIDRQARIVRFNPAAERIFGYTKREVEGRPVNLLMPDPYASEHDDYIARYEETRTPRAIGRIRAVTGKRKSGEIFPIELSVTEIRADEEVHYAAFIRDISEKVRLQERIIENERLAAIGVTAAKLAHEVGNPLNGMGLSAQMLERQLANTGSGGKIMERVHGLRQQITRLSQLLQEFRHLSRRQDYRLAPTNLSLLVNEVLTAEMEQYTSLGVMFVHESTPDVPLVKADASKLRQVIVNLCKNAVEAMPTGGTLTIREQRNGSYRVHLHVSDTGKGIPDDVNIFEPFVTTKSEGTGLGLPVVRQIVAAHGGELTYRTALGQGTTFTVSLMAMDEEKSS